MKRFVFAVTITMAAAAGGCGEDPFRQIEVESPPTNLDNWRRGERLVCDASGCSVVQIDSDVRRYTVVDGTAVCDNASQVVEYQYGDIFTVSCVFLYPGEGYLIVVMRDRGSGFLIESVYPDGD